MIYTSGFQQDFFLFKRINQTQFVIMGIQNQAWMWIEGKNDRFAIHHSCQFLQSFNNLIVSQMHPIESADGDNRIYGWKII